MLEGLSFLIREKIKEGANKILLTIPSLIFFLDKVEIDEPS